MTGGRQNDDTEWQAVCPDCEQRFAGSTPAAAISAVDRHECQTTEDTDR